MEKISIMRHILAEYQLESGYDPRHGHSLVVDVAGASALMREIFLGWIPRGVLVTPNEDELVQIDGVPVRLRFLAPYGRAFLVPDESIPARQCCDATAMTVMLTCMARGVSG